MKKEVYKKELYKLQVELVKFQKYVIAQNVPVCIVLEGRDTAGKDGTIKRFTEHLSPREARTVALGVPSDKEKKSWYFQRYVPHLPSAGEIVFFNRSWYNRAGVEKVMGFCTQKQYWDFMEEVGNFEQMLTHSNIRFFKYYLDISKKEQKKRLDARKTDPLKQWKLSPIDAKAQKMWDAYSKARDDMFNKTSFVYVPWYIVHTDDKKEARINIMKHFLSLNDYPDKDEALLVYDHDVICKFDAACYEKEMIAP
ncbi:polyphosphate kinase 2 [Sulfurovum sp.]|uniref:polyphosphate kinase 2 n=1 Tax=Sulfurovum sp. TaxID=1969726 RepID=UPI0025EA4A7B|nr:polyphosphate kinase 2 [Sulfurovum sp.]